MADTRSMDIQNNLLNKFDLKEKSADFLAIRDEVSREFADIEKALIRRKDLVLKLGRAIETYGKEVKKQDICRAIKFYLKEAIEKELISSRLIDMYCPDEWKNDTKPKKKEKISFSPEVQTIAIATDGTQEPVTATANIPQQTEGENLSQPVDEEKEKRIALLANQLAEKAAEISRQNADIEALKQEKKALEEQISQVSIKPASELAENPQELKKRIQDQAKLLLPFSVHVEMEAQGRFVPLIVRVEPVNRRVAVTIDEAAVRRMSEA